jgi:hypothetical protein
VWSIDRVAGKLVEIRIASPVSLEETVPWSAAHDALIASIDGPYVCFVDLVDATVFPADVVNGYVKTMRNEERLLRTGTLLNTSPTLGMQIHRMIREANHPSRRAFHEPRELFEWLAEVLDRDERDRLRDLLRARGMPLLSTRT